MYMYIRLEKIVVVLISIPTLLKWSRLEQFYDHIFKNFGGDSMKREVFLKYKIKKLFQFTNPLLKSD